MSLIDLNKTLEKIVSLTSGGKGRGHAGARDFISIFYKFGVSKRRGQGHNFIHELLCFIHKRMSYALLYGDLIHTMGQYDLTQTDG